MTRAKVRASAPVALGPSPRPGAVVAYRSVSTAGDDAIALAREQVSARGWEPLSAVIVEEYVHSNRATVALWCMRPASEDGS